jgi:hypothetical protein
MYSKYLYVHFIYKQASFCKGTLNYMQDLEKAVDRLHLSPPREAGSLVHYYYYYYYGSTALCWALAASLVS